MTTYAYLGPSGTFTESALRNITKVSDQLAPYANVTAALNAVRSGKCERALVPIERGEIGAVITPRYKGRAECAQIIAIALAFQLDDFRPQIAQHLCAKRARHHAGQVNHAQARERTGLWGFYHPASTPAHTGAQFEFLDLARGGFRQWPEGDVPRHLIPRHIGAAEGNDAIVVFRCPRL